jgi:hypothetical protein
MYHTRRATTITAAAIATTATVEAATITPVSFPVAGSAKRKREITICPATEDKAIPQGQPKLAPSPISDTRARA